MKRSILFALLSFCCSAALGQNAYFVDGYHGGIYGHYPVDWKTRFIVDEMQEHPEWRICLEIEPETWDTVKLKTPADYERFRAMAADSRVEFTNPAYAQPYCYNVSGESIIRQLEYGIAKIRTHFPDVEFVTYSVEEPCFTSCLPAILKSFGFRYAVLKCPNTCWGGYMRPYGGELVNWIGPDGTGILTVPRYACEGPEKKSTWQTTAWNNSTEYLDACFDYGIAHPAGMCFQDAGWKNGPWIGSGDRIKNNSIYVTWREYFESVSAGNPADDYRMSQEDVLVNLMWGSQVLQRIAQQVRRGENAVVRAEKMGVMANIVNGYRYEQERMDEAWRTLMLAQHHDSWIVPYNGLHKHGTWADAIERWTDSTGKTCEDITEAAAGSFTRGRSAGPRSGCVRVFNTTGVLRSEITAVTIPAEYAGLDVTVRDAGGRKIAAATENGAGGVTLTFRADVPAFGYAAYRLEAGKPAKSRTAKTACAGKDGFVVENDMYRIVFDESRGGVIKSLIAKKEGGKEYADKANLYSLGEIRGHFYDLGRFCSTVENPARITVLKDNGLETVVSIEGEIASHPFTQTVTIAQGRRRIDFDLNIDWKENTGIGEYAQTRDESWAANRRAWSDDRFKLNVLFPVALDSPQLYKDAPFDVCESGLESTAFNRWDSIKHNVVLNWVSLAEKGGHGLALFSDHTTSYSCAPDFPLGLTLQYSGYGLWSRDYNITAPLHVRYALIPYTGSWDSASVSGENNRWNEALITAYVPDGMAESRSFIDLSGTGYQISAARLTDNGGMLLRLFNAEGDGSVRRVGLGFAAVSVDEVSLSGELTGREKINPENGFAISIPRCGFKTFIISR